MLHVVMKAVIHSGLFQFTFSVACFYFTVCLGKYTEVAFVNDETIDTTLSFHTWLVFMVPFFIVRSLVIFFIQAVVDNTLIKAASAYAFGLDAEFLRMYKWRATDEVFSTAYHTVVDLGM